MSVRILMVYESFTFDGSEPTSHVLRGVVTDLLARGHDVHVYEPIDSRNRLDIDRERATGAPAFADAYPLLSSTLYDPAAFDLDDALRDADVVIVHESSDAELTRRIGEHRATSGGYVLLLHDTHHRSMTNPARLAELDLRPFDGVLTAGDAVTHLYIERGWSRRAWTWPAAADVRVFYPRRQPMACPPLPTKTTAPVQRPAVDDIADGDVVWIGNFGGHERGDALSEFLATPVRRLGIRAAVYGVGYPDSVIARLAAAGVEYRGWVDNFDVPNVFAQFTVTVHLPRLPYLSALPDVAPVRLFEAMACGIPLVSARWQDASGTFVPGEHYLVAHDADTMTAHLDALLYQPGLRRRFAQAGLDAVHDAHTCGHRVNRLLDIVEHVADRAEPLIERGAPERPGIVV